MKHSPLLHGLMGCLITVCAVFSFFPAFSAPPCRASETAVPPEELLRMMDTFGWDLSPEGERLYYYLLLSDGLAERSRPAVDTALKGLLRLDPSLPVFRDSVTILLTRKDFATAEQIAKTGLDKFPGDPTLTLLLAALHTAKDQIPQAITLLEGALKRRPDAPGVREISEELVRLYLHSGQGTKAADLLETLSKNDRDATAPDVVDEHRELFRAHVLSSVGRNAEAAELLRRMLERRPDLPNRREVWEQLAQLYLRDKKLGEAVTALQEAARLPQDSPMAEENADLHFRIALLQMERGLPLEAVKAMEQAANSPAHCLQVALLMVDRGHFNEAGQMLALAAKNGGNPDQIALYRSLLILEEGKKPLDALAPLESISPSSELYPRALQQKIRIYLQTEQYEQAAGLATKSREQFPEHKDLWGLEAYSLAKCKKNAEAETLIRKALDRFPNDEDLLFTLGSLQEEAGKKDAAMRTMEAILKANPRNYQALNYVGYTLADKNTDLQRALALISTALEESPDSDYIVDSLAWVQFRLGRTEEAWKSINRCISLGGDDPAIWEHYGDIARALGNREEAAKGYEKSIALEPDNVADVRKKLRAVQNK